MSTVRVKLDVARERLDHTRAAFSRDWLTYSMLAPVLLIMGVLVWGSLLDGIWMSFHSFDFLGRREWVGLENYQYILGWDTFWTSVRATLIFGLVTFFQLAIALVAAVAVKHARFRDYISALFVIPYTIPGLVSGTLWVFILHPDLGPILPLLVDLGILDQTIYWGTQGNTAMAVIMFAATWAYWPLVFIILTASLDGIPEEQYETARVYGASKVQAFFHITLPQLKGAILVAVSLRTIYNLTKVSQPLQITGGGPGFDTSVLGILVYRFTEGSQRFGLAMSVGVVLVLLTMLFVVPYIRSFERNADTGGMT
ncbi:sugar ABC transporter permease [Halogeometricum sp. S1BR25-6]|uniref:Sugar ABC transporter permease n=1 Tax=Halogeometricum salsisoli TaxID=2950536 RepID=A0ABU2GHC5_9EURY|nr:sugar ABC transporter permease [Halogeometricum sp. S1BR25-6]MDS0300179.1 sugar ABC transporter permease [Halogeometricum sp. S1BR25-6]